VEAEVPPIGRLDDRPASPGRVGDAPRRVVAREQLPHRVAVPALVTRLDGEADPLWERGERLVAPAGEDVCCGEPVEGAVDLDRLEAPCVEAQPARHRQVCGVEAARPVAVLPPRRPDPQGHVPFLPRFERASFRPRACRAWACPRTARRRRRRARAWRAGGEGRSWTRRTLAAGQPPSGGAEGGAT
jgi:hypothetical protein